MNGADNMSGADKLVSAEIVKIADILAISDNNVFIVTDEHINSLYGDVIKTLCNGNPSRLFVLKAGEAEKHLGTVSQILTKMTLGECDRKTTLFSVGGGVTGDIGGFCASIYMRGIKWVNIPTTLLAMVDSSVGGKTGVNLECYKNTVGSFHLPSRVLICPEFLCTLPKREWLSGSGEIVKHTLLSPDLYEFYHSTVQGKISPNADYLPALIEKNVRFKEGIVRKDFREAGLRKILNAGHTVGHALEKIDNFTLSHGEYVACGMACEMKMFKSEIDEGFYGSAIKLLKSVCEKKFTFTPEQIIEAATADKKNDSGLISIIVVINVGNYKEFKITRAELKRRLECI